MSDKLNQLAEEYAIAPMAEADKAAALAKVGGFERVRELIRQAFKAGHASRDAEVAEKDAEIMRLKEKLWAAEGRIKGMTDGLEILKGEK